MHRFAVVLLTIVAICAFGGCSSTPAGNGDEGADATVADTGQFDQSLDTLSKDLCTSVTKAGKPDVRLVVYYFAFAGKEQTPLGDYVAATLPVYIKMHAPAALRVFSRRKLEEAREELALQSQVLFDKDSTAKVGQLVGANILVTGDIFDKASDYEMTASAIDVSTGEILASSRVKCPKTDDLSALAQASGAAATPAETPAQPTSDTADESFMGTTLTSSQPAAGTSDYIESGSEDEVRIQKGNFFLERGQNGRALAYYNRAGKTGALGDVAYARMGEVFLRNGKTDQARDAFKQALAKNENSLDAMVGLAIVNFRAHDYTGAERLLKQAAQARPNDPHIQMHLGILYIQQKRYAEAARILEPLARGPRSRVETREAYGVALAHLRRTSEAERVFRTVLKERPAALFANYYLGRIDYDRKNYREARQFLALFVQRAPKNRVFQSRRDEAEKMLKEIDRAEKRNMKRPGPTPRGKRPAGPPPGGQRPPK